MSDFAIPEPDICRRNHGGNPESEAANRRTSKSADYRKITEFLKFCALEGATCDQIEFELSMPHQTASARCSELLKNGTAVRMLKNGKTLKRMTRRGSFAAVLIHASFLNLNETTYDDNGQGRFA